MVYTKGNSVKLSENFSSHEFDCHGNGCCSETVIDEKLVEYLQKIREHFGKPITVTSAYRCPTHNRNVGGATKSYHAQGKAADIQVAGVLPSEVAKYAESIGVLGIGLYQTSSDGYFVHIDTRTSKYFWYGQAQEYRSTFGGHKESVNVSNSSLISYTKISPNCSDRTSAIKKITIHHAASTGTIESMGNYFALPHVECSANYGVGSDGRIALYVPENKRAWTSSSRDNDNQAITIEVANSSTGGDWPVSDAALEATIKLCVDICKRNNIGKLNFTGNSKGNLTMHCYFANTACPGPYLKSKFQYIAEEVNRRLGIKAETPKQEVSAKFNIGDVVKLKSGATYYNGATIPAWLFSIDLYVRNISGDEVVVSRLKTGAVTGVVNIKNLTLVSEVQPSVKKEPVVSNNFNVGDAVRLVSGATYHNGKKIPAWVFNLKLYVREIQGDNIVISRLKIGPVTGVVNKKYLTRA
jgi:transcription antitermination factor NusG